ncbi:hypothetical protein PspLS_08693 [Pyricularia sp. CBS 133598]|nr:hypothetical protein PspLS_08693 [Pyricularia sp. CBS 133598]
MQGFSILFIASLLSGAVTALPASTASVTNDMDVQHGLGQDERSPNIISARANPVPLNFWALDRHSPDEIRQSGGLNPGSKLWNSYYNARGANTDRSNIYRIDTKEIETIFRQAPSARRYDADWQANQVIPATHLHFEGPTYTHPVVTPAKDVPYRLFHVDNRQLDTIRKQGGLERGIKLYELEHYAIQEIAQNNNLYVYEIKARKTPSSFHKVHGKDQHEQNWEAVARIPYEYIEIFTWWEPKENMKCTSRHWVNQEGGWSFERGKPQRTAW